jgi:hypothetical protein
MRALDINRNRNWVLVFSFIQALVAFGHVVLLGIFPIPNYLYWFSIVNLPCALIGLSSSSFANDAASVNVYIVAVVVTLVSTLVGVLWEVILIVECFDVSGISCIASVGISWVYLLFGLIYSGLCVMLIYFYAEIKSEFTRKEALDELQKRK